MCPLYVRVARLTVVFGTVRRVGSLESMDPKLGKGAPNSVQRVRGLFHVEESILSTSSRV